MVYQCSGFTLYQPQAPEVAPKLTRLVMSVMTVRRDISLRFPIPPVS